MCTAPVVATSAIAARSWLSQVPRLGRSTVSRMAGAAEGSMIRMENCHDDALRSNPPCRHRQKRVPPG